MARWSPYSPFESPMILGLYKVWATNKKCADVQDNCSNAWSGPGGESRAPRQSEKPMENTKEGRDRDSGWWLTAGGWHFTSADWGLTHPWTIGEFHFPFELTALGGDSKASRCSPCGRSPQGKNNITEHRGQAQPHTDTSSLSPLVESQHAIEWAVHTQDIRAGGDINPKRENPHHQMQSAQPLWRPYEMSAFVLCPASAPACNSHERGRGVRQRYGYPILEAVWRPRGETKNAPGFKRYSGDNTVHLQDLCARQQLLPVAWDT